VVCTRKPVESKFSTFEANMLFTV